MERFRLFERKQRRTSVLSFLTIFDVSVASVLWPPALIAPV